MTMRGGAQFPFCTNLAQVSSAADLEGNGRGGIRTHGGFPHARFRVECLKPDSATLPKRQKKRRTPNVQHPAPTEKPILICHGFGGLRILLCFFRISIFDFEFCSHIEPLAARLRSSKANRRLGSEKCYNFNLATPSPGTAYCMSQGQPTLLLVVDRYSQLVCAAVHKYSHLIENLNPPLPP